MITSLGICEGEEGFVDEETSTDEEVEDVACIDDFNRSSSIPEVVVLVGIVVSDFEECEEVVVEVVIVGVGVSTIVTSFIIFKGFFTDCV